MQARHTPHCNHSKRPRGVELLGHLLSLALISAGITTAGGLYLQQRATAADTTFANQVQRLVSAIRLYSSSFRLQQGTGNITANIASDGFVPVGWIYDPTTQTLTDPYHGGVTLTTSGYDFTLTIANVPYRACGLTAALLGAKQVKGLIGMTIGVASELQFANLSTAGGLGTYANANCGASTTMAFRLS